MNLFRTLIRLLFAEKVEVDVVILPEQESIPYSTFYVGIDSYTQTLPDYLESEKQKEATNEST